MYHEHERLRRENQQAARKRLMKLAQDIRQVDSLKGDERSELEELFDAIEEVLDRRWRDGYRRDDGNSW